MEGRAKKAKVDASAAVHPVPVKQEVQEVEMEGGGKSTAIVVAAADGNISNPRINLSFDKTKFDCPLCTHPLKPPIFQCDALHFACGACHAVALPSNNSRVRYCDLDDHQRRACPFASCCCPEQGCPFVGSPPMLIDHIAAEHTSHHRPLVSARYGQDLELTISAALRWRALVGPDRSLFVVSMGASGQDAAVSVVCVRANAAAGVAPQYRCRLGVKVWGGGDDDDDDDVDRDRQVVVMEYKVCSSALPAERAGPDERAFMGLYHHLPLHQTVALSIRIDMLQPAGATVAVTTPGKPSPATTPGARSSSRLHH
ncbi:hypothetical protein QOZ80_1AG0016000 [Eleusine coracana subsp. coracana]|nr:hypothetical protein QOZ80_1AG0016000 [Eleusine coracana subsp. coracana]